MPPHIIDYRKAQTFDDIAEFLGLKATLLEQAIAASRAPDAPPIVYVRHRIPKRRGTGQFRTVWDVDSPQIRDAHRAFAWRFEDFAKDVVSNFPHPCAYGYVRKRGIKDNAAQHAGAKVLLRCDLKDFFSTINFDRLVGRFIQLGIQSEIAGMLAGFVTIERKLALGLNASPLLANLVCSALDEKLQQLAASCDCRYTRYADDIAISGEGVPASGNLAEIIEGEGFRISEGKMRITKLGQAHFVTGLSVSDQQGPHVPRRFKRRLRQELYYCRRFGIRSHLTKVNADTSYQKGINRLDGSVRFVSSIELRLGLAMRQMWRESLATESANVSYSPVHDKTGVNATFLVDETEFELDGMPMLAVACVTTQQIEVIRAHVMTTLRKHMMDPFSPGRKRSLAAKGLHFADAPEGLRSEYIRFLPYLQFRAYLAFAQLRSPDSYASLYTSLLESLLAQRFRSFDRGTVTIYAEQNSKITETQVQELVGGLYRDLERRNERRPVVPPLCALRAKRDEPAFSLVDCLLWIFGRVFGAKEGAGETDYLHFERLRDKYRHIVNADSEEVFSRRHPIEMRRRGRTREP